MNLPSLNLGKVRGAKQPPIYGKYGQQSARTNRDHAYGMQNAHRGAGRYKIPNQNRQAPYGFGGNRKRAGQQQTSFAGPSNFSFTSNHHQRRRNRHQQQAYAQHISPKRRHHHKPIVDNKNSNPYRNQNFNRNRVRKGEGVESSGGAGVHVPKLNVGESWAQSRGGKHRRRHAGGEKRSHHGKHYANGSQTARDAPGRDKVVNAQPTSARAAGHYKSKLYGSPRTIQAGKPFKGRPSAYHEKMKHPPKQFGGHIGGDKQEMALNKNSSSIAGNVDNGSPRKGSDDQWPLTPAQAFKLYMNDLSDFEHGEILEYPEIYCTGAADKKIRKNSGNNHGYDDERGDYKIVVNDHIAYRYEVLGTVGKGSFGQVMKCYDNKKKEMVALKIIRNKKRFHHQALVEVKVLKNLKEKDPNGSSNIIHLKDYFYFRNHLCITFGLMSVNLYEFIKNNNFQGVSLGLIRRFAIQILASLRFMRKLKIIHCDLKPENILLKQSNKSGIKVIDLGSSCYVDERVYTYIQSRFYRSPEVILGLPYGTPIDMWSFGCILAELYTGYPIFPGENEQEQLLCIMEIQGQPPAKMVESSNRSKLFFDQSGNPRIVPNSRGRKRNPGTKTISSALKCQDRQFVEFLEGCLRWDPKSRFTPSQALKHPWIADSPAPQHANGEPDEVTRHGEQQTMGNDLTALPSLDLKAAKRRGHY